MMLRLVPNIFYDKLSDGLDFFVTCLGFSVLYQDDGACGRQRATGPKPIWSRAPNSRQRTVRKSQSRPTRSRTSLRKCPRERRTFSIPMSNQIEMKPWGFREFGVRDKTDVFPAALALILYASLSD